MTVEVIVPWRDTGCPHRAAALDWVLRRYVTHFPTWKVTLASDAIGGAGQASRGVVVDERGKDSYLGAVEGGQTQSSVTHGGDRSDPWIKARAVNPAVDASSADVIVCGDADCWSEGIGEAVEQVVAGRCAWAVPYWWVHRFTPDYTARVLNGTDPAEHSSASLIERPRHPVYPGGGIVVATRQLAVDAPLDPRFEGWGGEDFAWGRALRTFGGKPGLNTEILYHLWHPPQDRPGREVLPPANLALCHHYHAAYRKPGRMRALLDEIPQQQGAQL